jgi:hypothetical protein
MRDGKLRGSVKWRGALKQKGVKQGLGICMLIYHDTLLINCDIFKILLPVFSECHIASGRQHCLPWHGTQDEFQYFILQEVSVPAINAQ